MNLQEQNFSHNRRILVLFHLLTSAALCMAGSLVLLDVLLLRIGIDLDKFGVVKSSIYFLPPLSYLVLAPWLQRLNRDREVTVAAYLIRVLLPLPMPLLPLVIENHNILIACFMVILALAFSCAMIGNNTLLTIFKRAFPDRVYNRSTALVAGAFSLPAVFLALPVAALLDMARDWSDTAFLLFFALLQLGTVILEIPAAVILWRIRLAENRRPPVRCLRDYLIPYRDRIYRLLMVLTFLHSLWIGLLGTYLTVFLLTVRQWPLILISTVELILTVGMAAAAVLLGVMTDRYGYRRIFGVMTVLSLAVSVIFVGWIAVPAVVAVFVLLVYNGNQGGVSGAMRTLEQAAAGSLCDPERPKLYLAGFTLWLSFGSFAGTLAAGIIYHFLEGFCSDPGELYRWYFLVAALPLAAILIPLKLWPAKRTG